MTICHFENLWSHLTCFRIGGLKPGEKKVIRGKLYIVLADVGKLVARFEKDFPEQQGK